MGQRKRRSATGAASWLAFDAQRLGRRLSGARMCFGRPVTVGSRTVIPVASLRTAGGLGFGRSPGGPDAAAGPQPGATPAAAAPLADNLGGGGGGVVDARPLGFIDIGPEGASYRPIPTGGPPLLRLALAGAVVWAGARALGPRAVTRRRAAAGRRWPGRSLRR